MYTLPELRRTNENGSQNGTKRSRTVLSFTRTFSWFSRTIRTVLEHPQNLQNVPERSPESPRFSRTPTGTKVPYYLNGVFVKNLQI
jgi:hypothetical protein